MVASVAPAGTSGECFPLLNTEKPLPEHCPRASRRLHFFVELLHGCRNVRQCLMVWHFLVSYVGWRTHWTNRLGTMFGWPAMQLREGLAELQHLAHGRGKHWAEMDSLTMGVHVVARALGDEGLQASAPPSSSRSALVTHFAAASEDAALQAEPFADLLACFAARQGLKFVHDQRPFHEFSWVRWTQSGVLQDAYVLGVGPFSAGPLGTARPGANVSEHVLASLKRVLRPATSAVADLTTYPYESEPLFTALGRKLSWQRVEAHLGIINGPPVRWAKVFAIEEALEKHEAIIFMDYDITVRPDCLGAARLLDELFRPSRHQTVPSIAVRDTPHGMDCLNSGFLALRRTPVAQAFVRMWKEKMRWPGSVHGDQGAFAETLLEILDLEHRLRQTRDTGIDFKETQGYDHRCIATLFPLASGMHTWRKYCDCYQYYLQVLTGSYRERRSSFVHFVDPREMDVNFVPQHQADDLQSLRNMRLLPWQVGERVVNLQGSPVVSARVPLLPEITPLLVHWAGAKNRTKLMRHYLMRRFRVPPGWFNRGRSRWDRCAALSDFSPRLNPSCKLGALGSNIEHVYQNWDDDIGPDHVRSLSAENESEMIFAEAVANESEALPDRADDHWTVTARFRSDMLDLIGGEQRTRDMVVIEIGSYLGYTTSFLAGAFKAVLGLEAVTSYVIKANQLLERRGHSNAKVIELNTLRDDFSRVAAFARANGGADMLLVDGDHSYATVLNDLSLALYAGLGSEARNGRPLYIALDDYFARAEVQQAVADFVKFGHLQTVGTLGIDEGILCEVANGSIALQASQMKSQSK